MIEEGVRLVDARQMGDDSELAGKALGVGRTKRVTSIQTRSSAASAYRRRVRLAQHHSSGSIGAYHVLASEQVRNIVDGEFFQLVCLCQYSQRAPHSSDRSVAGLKLSLLSRHAMSFASHVHEEA